MRDPEPPVDEITRLHQVIARMKVELHMTKVEAGRELAEAKEKLSSLPEVVQIGWITGESLRRLKKGGNKSRATVPVHSKPSHVATVQVYMNNSSSVKLPGHDEVLDKLRAIKCERKEG